MLEQCSHACDSSNASREELTFDLEEGRKELVLVLLGRDRVGKLLAIVEWLQQGLKAIVDRRHPSFGAG